jgi:hypothetical protein
MLVQRETVCDDVISLSDMNRPISPFCPAWLLVHRQASMFDIFNTDFEEIE